ncbi:unnamed protein product, partial [Discosporangium mesarthrocarpum]
TPTKHPASPIRSAPKDESKELVGRRIKVFWPADAQWYHGKVVDFSSEDGKHCVEYEDGDKERVLLSDEKATSARTSTASRLAKPRRIVEDDDEDEMEWDEGADDGGDDEMDGSFSGSDSDADSAPTTGRNKRTAASPHAVGPLNKVAKRLKKSSSGYKITETKSPPSLRNFAARPDASHASPKISREVSIKTPTIACKSKASPCTTSESPASRESLSPVPAQTPSQVPLPEGVLETGRHKHHGLHWLYKDRTDKNRRPPSHPEYNPRTLYVPPSFLKSETPAMQQWWEFKRENMDTVLFFKVGKFYELFHQDADVGMQELDLIYMKGEKAHSGFPEISYGKFADILVSKGYRVARVEQVETPDMLKARNASMSKNAVKSKVVKRELCSILSRGTRTYCFLDDVASTPDGSPSSVNMILSIKEHAVQAFSVDAKSEGLDGPPKAVCEYGLCMVDATTATFSLGQFADDPARSRLRTLLAQQPPAEIILEKDNLSETSLHMIKCMAPGAVHTVLRKDEEFWSAPRTISEIKKARYFPCDTSKGEDLLQHWPPILKAVVDGGNDGALALSALGGALWHTRRALIDHDLLSMQRFGAYIPPDDHVPHPERGVVAAGTDKDTSALEGLQNASSLPGGAIGLPGRSHMVLDGVSLSNLEVLRNNSGGEKGSLWGYVNRCGTAFGRRLLKDWVCKPLLRPR